MELTRNIIANPVATNVIPESSFVTRVRGVNGRKRIRREIDVIEDLFEVDGLAR